MTGSLLRSTASVAAMLVAGGGVASAQAVRITLTRLATIGCEDCTDSRHLGKIQEVAVSAQGTVLVVDGEAPAVRIFSSDGKPVRQFGRSGRGPGEYMFVMRAGFGPGGTMHLLDMTTRRITHLAADGTLGTIVPISGFPGAVSPRGETGEMVVMSDDFRGTLTLNRWAADASEPVPITKLENPRRPDGGISLPGIAVSATGEVALARDAEQYRILRFAPDGKALADIVRDIPRLRRTAEEQAEMDRRMKNVRERVTAEKGRSTAPAPVVGSTDLALKPHFFFGGLRYDDEGRLWVQTMRGTPSRAVLDVFGRDGAYLGEVTVPSSVQAYSLGGKYMVTAGEREDGTPVVEVWRVGG